MHIDPLTEALIFSEVGLIRRREAGRWNSIAVGSAVFQTCSVVDFQIGRACTSTAGLETRDTADWDVCATIGESDAQTVATNSLLRLLLVVLLMLFAHSSFAQSNTPPVLNLPDWVVAETNIAYDRYEATVLDVLRPREKFKGQRPGIVMFHGGGWVRSNKETMMGSFCLPYLKQGFIVCNVEYRLAPVATAPAAVNDALKATQWFFEHAAKYNVDTNRIVVTGASAGGHLALMVGMVDASSDLGPISKVAAIVNGYGITDVADVLEGLHKKSWAVQWLPEQEKRLELAKRLSPMTYVRKGLPPILTVQGANDTTVPVEQGRRLTQALKGAGVDTEMMIVPGAGHGFSREQWPEVHEKIFSFLKQRGILLSEAAIDKTH
jgi:acetyl esterase/lipase